MVSKKELMGTKSLEEAIRLLFQRTPAGRACILATEAMTGDVAREYDSLGISRRKDTYRKIAEDFQIRTGCYGVNHPTTGMDVGPILEVGCGSGLLALELAEQTNSQRITGLDISGDMISLATLNLHTRSKQRTEEIKQFWRKLPESCRPTVEEYKKLKQRPPFLDRIQFVQGSVYDLADAGFQNMNYIVCRNALHRFQYLEKALEQMYNALSPDGTLYIRDLKRDANWQTILERIGEERWNTSSLVPDYIGAMAAMLTPTELERALRILGILKFKIADGKYLSGESETPDNIKEYEQETEYVCVIKNRS